MEFTLDGYAKTTFHEVKLEGCVMDYHRTLEILPTQPDVTISSQVVVNSIEDLACLDVELSSTYPVNFASILIGVGCLEVKGDPDVVEPRLMS